MCEGLLMLKCKQIYINGASEHFRQYYNFMDFSLLALYMASYALRFATYYRVTEASLHYNVSAKINNPLQMRWLLFETTKNRNDRYGYFMAAGTFL